MGNPNYDEDDYIVDAVVPLLFRPWLARLLIVLGLAVIVLSSVALWMAFT